MKNITTSILLLALVSSCTPVTQSQPPASRDVPEITGNATGNKLDPATVRPDNPGYLMDLNGDGVVDFILLSGNTVYFKASNTGTAIPILTIKAEIVAYRIDADGIFFWNRNHDGFVQRKIGVNGNLPYYGNVESQ